MSVERVYQKKTQLEHILLRPDTYIGSVEPLTQVSFIKLIVFVSFVILMRKLLLLLLKILFRIHRIAQVGKDLKDHQVQPHPNWITLTNSCPLNHVPEHHIQISFKYIQS